jgi:hypothetical protein
VTRRNLVPAVVGASVVVALCVMQPAAHSTVVRHHAMASVIVRQAPAALPVATRASSAPPPVVTATTASVPVVVPTTTAPPVASAPPPVAPATSVPSPTTPVAVPGPQPIGTSQTVTATNCVVTWPINDATSGTGQPIASTGYFQGSCPAAAAFAAQEPGATVAQVSTTTTEQAP